MLLVLSTPHDRRIPSMSVRHRPCCPFDMRHVSLDGLRVQRADGAKGRHRFQSFPDDLHRPHHGCFWRAPSSACKPFGSPSSEGAMVRTLSARLGDSRV